MKPLRAISCVASMLSLVTLTSGCLTQQCLTPSQINTDKFNPFTIYQSKNAGRFALEGTYCDLDYVDEHAENFFAAPRSHGYLIISQKKLTSHHFETNGLVLLDEIKKLSPKITTPLKPENKLPANYEKVADLPKNDVILNINERRHYSGLIVMLPFAFAVDVVAFPLEALTALAFANGRT